MEIITIILSLLSFICAASALVAVLRIEKNVRRNMDVSVREAVSREVRSSGADIVAMTQGSIKNMGDMLAASNERTRTAEDKRLSDMSEAQERQSVVLRSTLTQQIAKFDDRFASFALANAQTLSEIRTSVEKQMTAMREDNAKQLDQMRHTVDEKLQKTLDERINKSFAVVSERLEQVYKGLGEMQTLAAGVGDLKKILSNVKTRGILGEVQLGAILEEILSPEQYDTNVVTRKNSGKPVEYAVKMPGQDGECVYLPIDAKFPADAYSRLCDAYDTSDPAAVESAAKTLETELKSFARDIRDKYIDPPHTTDFGIMFLPFEGLYAEAVRRGLVETFQRNYKVSIAGPTTMAALLNSLQMGFKTLAIQKRSSEVWRVLGAVKTEFGRFGDALETAQKRLEMASGDLDKLVGVRTRQINAKLRTVTAIPDTEASVLLNEEQQ